MADHKRKNIRAAIVALLIDGETAAASRVYKGRTIPLQKEDGTSLPAILVYTPDERSSIHNEAPREYERVCRVSIECVVAVNDDIDDALDDIAKEVEEVFDDNRYLVVALTEESEAIALASDSVLNETTTFFAKNGERDVGCIKLTYDVTYYTNSPEEISSLGEAAPLESVSVVYKVGNRVPGTVPDVDDAQDFIEVEQDESP